MIGFHATSALTVKTLSKLKFRKQKSRFINKAKFWV